MNKKNKVGGGYGYIVWYIVSIRHIIQPNKKRDEKHGNVEKTTNDLHLAVLKPRIIGGLNSVLLHLHPLCKF